MLTRRQLMRLGLLGTGYSLLPHNGPLALEGVSSADDDAPSSPRTTPFVDRLQLPPEAVPVQPFYGPLNPGVPVPPTYERFVGPNTQFFEVIAEQRYAKFHRDFGMTSVWGYRDATVPAGQWPSPFGPTLTGLHGFNALGGGMVVRHRNGLPADHKGFGVPYTTVHFHGGHHLAESDGFPIDVHNEDGSTLRFVSAPGEYLDHCYPVLDTGFCDHDEDPNTPEPDPTERPAMLWYHDHLLDFTAANVYRGLAGISLMFDELDSDDEEGLIPGGLRLPAAPYDIPLVLQDRRFNADYSLRFDSFDHDGLLGDKFLVNGVIQPFLDVEKRKYRFRFLNASSARIYRLYLTNDLGQTFPMTQIATEGGLLSRPLPGTQSVLIAPAERIEVVVDFGDADIARQPALFLENRLQQTDGRKPDGTVSRGTRLVKFNLTGDVVPDDPSRIGREENNATVLRHFEPIGQDVLSKAVRRTFEFERSGGAWVINDRLAGELQTPRARSKRSAPEIWKLVNKSGGWWHPIHIHSEFMRVLRRNGSLPPMNERDGIAKKDTILLKDNDSVEVFLQFRDYTGPFVFHCHNLQHEDMAMMARFDVV